MIPPVMDDFRWKSFFQLCVKCLGRGDVDATSSESWCAWTTYRRISEEFGYWTSGLPALSDICDTHISDGGVWRQPFSYSDIAHIVIPRTFYWESYSDNGFENGLRTQDIDFLSRQLILINIEHRVTDLVLEIKLY
jgi:hypothetical protein